MNRFARKTPLILVALVGSALLAGSALAAVAGIAQRAPTGVAFSTLPSSSCPDVAGVPTCELWAKTGTLALPGAPAPVNIWGYSSTEGGAAQVPGPTFVVNEGQALDLILHNVDVPGATSLDLPLQAFSSDGVGVTAGGQKTYSFRPTIGAVPGELVAGTYLYQAGMTADGPRQVAMGLFGGLIVRPADPATAYGSASSAFDDEALVVLSEIDPAFNANPMTFDMSTFKPKYWLINGAAYPSTAAITSDTGSRLLLRYANAGLMPHSMGLLGLRQTVIAADGHMFDYSYRVVAETIPPGATLDAIATMPTTTSGRQYAVYDAGSHIDNAGALSGGQVSLGGMLTFINVGVASATPVPVTSNVTLNPNPTGGDVDVALTATVTESDSAGPNIVAARYFIDALGGTATPMTLATSGATSTDVSATISSATLGTLTPGSHTFYVQGQDAAGAAAIPATWGPVASAVLVLDKGGPAVSSISLNPSSTNGSASVGIGGTAIASAAGNSVVTAAEYFIGTPGANGSGTALQAGDGTFDGTIEALVGSIGTGAIPVADGSYVISIHAQDNRGNWGAFGTATLLVDRNGPTASLVTVAPSPNNGQIAYPGSTPPGIRVGATFADSSPISGGEVFIDSVGANGTGALMIASDGAFDSSSEGAYAILSLSSMQTLAEGSHTIYVRGRDVAGNWGITGGATLVIDHVKPVISSLSAPAPTCGRNTVTLSGIATDAAPSTGIVRVEWYEGTDPGAGNGNAMTYNAGTGAISATITVTQGSHTFFVRAKDAATNWSTVMTVSVAVPQVQADAIFSNGFETTNLTGPWSSTVGGTRIASTTAAAMTGSRGLSSTVNTTGGGTAYVQSTSPNNETCYRARFQFNPNGAASGTGLRILDAISANSTSLLRVEYRRTGAAAPFTYQVRGVVRSGGVDNTAANQTAWYTINNGATNTIEVAWQAGAGTGSFALYVNGTLMETKSGLSIPTTPQNNALVQTVRLGVSSGSVTATSTLYFDNFASRRQTYIGP